MRNLVAPSRVGDRATLEQALSPYQHRGMVLGYAGSPEEVESVLALYDAYDAGSGVAAEALTAPEMNANLKQAIHNSYDRTLKGRLKHVRQQVLAQVELCPVCGIGTPTELDHVLPRVDYKALAIYVRNLVPLCHLCNHRKLAGFAEPGELGFVHAYFDILPDVQFLRADVELAGNALIVDFSIDAVDPALDGIGERLDNIHHRLELNDRYRAEVNVYAFSQSVALHLVYATAGAIGVQRYLRAQGDEDVRRLYRNHWRPTLLFALSEHAAFCNGGFALVIPTPGALLVDILNPA